MDISPSMLAVALEREVQGDLLLSDIGSGLPFRPGAFDAAVSISALQWLCNAETNTQTPALRLHRFFQSLFASLRRGGKAVLQFYPESDHQSAMIMSIATKCGFGGGVVVDDAESKKKRKYYLCLATGPTASTKTASVQGQARKIKNRGAKVGKTREYITHKKELNRRRGKPVPNDSRYTGRKRRTVF